MQTFKRYILPCLPAVLLLIALGLWADHEMDYARQRALNHLEETSTAVLKSLEGSIRSQVYRGRYARTRLQPILENVIASTGILFVQVRMHDIPAISAGEKPALPDLIPGSTGRQFIPGVFVLWESVRLGECIFPGKGRGRHHHGNGRPPQPGDLNFGNEEQMLIIGVSDSPYRQTIDEAKNRLLFSGGAGALAVLVILGAWFLAMHNRTLEERLSAARARASHLEELGLSAAGLAHETKNPLGIIRGLAQRIHQENIPPEKIRAISENIMNEVDVASARLGRFMKYAKPVVPKTEPVWADTFLKHINDLLQSDFDTAGIRLVTRAGHIAILADRDMLQQVVLNLLLNSLKASAAGSTIEIEITPDPKHAVLVVRDRGCGIPEELMPAIFKPYISGHTDGHGMGLAIVKRIVEDHGWNITIDSAPGEGTRVTISRMALATEGAPG